MLKIKKLSKVMCIALLMSIIFAVVSNAAGYLVRDTGNGLLSTGANHAYDESWGTTDYFDDGRGVMTYGFNTFMFDEDYCKSLHTMKTHSSWVKNSKYDWQHTGDTAAGKWTSQVSMGHGTYTYWQALYY